MQEDHLLGLRPTVFYRPKWWLHSSVTGDFGIYTAWDSVLPCEDTASPYMSTSHGSKMEKKKPSHLFVQYLMVRALAQEKGTQHLNLHLCFPAKGCNQQATGWRGHHTPLQPSS